MTMATGRRLRVRTRREPHPGESGLNWTLFARLSPDMAQALHDDACCLTNSDTTTVTQEFLPLLLSGMDDHNVYVSYNGGSIAEKGAFPLQ
jgi:hypothetical protein